MFGVCRASVREAMRALALMGHLEVHQGKGAYLLEAPPKEDPATERWCGTGRGGLTGPGDLRNLLECKAVALPRTGPHPPNWKR